MDISRVEAEIQDYLELSEAKTFTKTSRLTWRIRYLLKSIELVEYKISRLKSGLPIAESDDLIIP